MKYTSCAPKLLLSLDSLRLWQGGAATFIKVAAHLIDGFEFSVSYDDLRSWESGIRLGIRALPPPFFDVGREVADLVFRKSGNVLRLSPLKFLPVGREFEVASDIRGLLNTIKLERISIDLSEVSEERAQLFMSLLPAGVQLVQLASKLAIIPLGTVTDAGPIPLFSQSIPALVYLNGPGQVFDSHNHFDLLDLASRAVAEGTGTGFIFALPIAVGDVVDGLGELVRLREMILGSVGASGRRVAV